MSELLSARGTSECRACGSGDLKSVLDLGSQPLPAEYGITSDDVLDVFEAQLMRRVSGLLYISDVDSGNSKKRAIMNLKDSNL